ncbi:MAG: hypothetical protein ACFE8B_14665 [Candidatus Hermodarchaeota archaeon]
MVLVIHEAGCGKNAMKIYFMNNIYPIIMDVIIVIFPTNFKK